MKKILLFLTVLALFSCRQESIEERAERDARETTAKRCPIRMSDDGTLIMERITFDKSTRTWCQDFLQDIDPEVLKEANYRDLLLQELKNIPSYKPYMDNGFTFRYVFCNMKNPKDTLVDVRLTPEDYR